MFGIGVSRMAFDTLSGNRRYHQQDVRLQGSVAFLA